jgi:WD40 repeat protein/tRNA A-37 threonylcarbamoyl transferase component Bud32
MNDGVDPQRSRSIEAILDQQSGSWNRGEPVAVEHLLDQWNELNRDADVVLDLIYHEVLLRQRRGETPTVDEYRRRFPQLANQVELQFEVHHDIESTSPEDTQPSDAVSSDVLADAIAIPGYTIEGIVGRGGMSVVYRARQDRLHRAVAIKMILAGSNARPQQLERLRSEAEAIARLQHPNIVQIHDIGEYRGAPYLALEYVAAGSLSSALEADAISPTTAARLVSVLSRAVHHAHGRGIIHRDLKPSNILLTDDGIPKVSDFGLAKLLDGAADSTASGAVLGTPSYMAPEQIDPTLTAIGPATDVYALGAILYELLAGRPPFKAQTPLQTIQLVQSADVIAPSRLQPGMPRDIETICLKCLQKDPGRRYASAAALAEDLSRFLENRPIHARRAGTPEYIWRWCRRNKVAATLGASVIALLVTTAVGASISVYWLQAGLKRSIKAETAAKAARIDADNALFDFSLDQAQAGRWNRTPGRRELGLKMLTRAAGIRPDPRLRDEAIACLSQLDLVKGQDRIAIPPGTRALAISNQFDLYARCDSEGRITIRRVADGTEIVELQAPFPATLALEFSDDGRTLAAVGTQMSAAGVTLRVWKVPEGTVILDDTGVGTPALCFDAGGSRLAAASKDGFVRVYDLARSREIIRFPCVIGPYSVAFSPDGLRLAVGSHSKGDLEIYDPGTGKLLTSFSGYAELCKIVWHPGGRYIATRAFAWADGFQVVILDTLYPTRTPRLLRGHQAPVMWVAFNHAGSHLASIAYDDELRVWDFATGEPEVIMPTDIPRPREGYALRFSADDHRLAFVHENDTAVFLDVVAGEVCRTIYYDRAASFVDISPDGRLMLLANDGMSLWDMSEGRQIRGLPMTVPSNGAFAAAAFNPRGSEFVTGSASGTYRWAIVKDPPEIRVEQSTDLGLDWRRGNIDFTGDGSVIAVCGDDHASLMRRDRPGDRVLLNHKGINTVALSPDGRWAATASFPTFSTVKVWEARTGRFLTDLPTPRAQLKFTPDSQWLVTGYGTEYRFWKVGSWSPGLIIPMVHRTESTAAFDFTGDGRTLAIAQSCHTVEFLDPATGRKRATLASSNAGFVQSLRFSNDGRWFVVVRWSHDVEIWDLRELRKRLQDMQLDWD